MVELVFWTSPIEIFLNKTWPLETILGVLNVLPFFPKWSKLAIFLSTDMFPRYILIFNITDPLWA